MLKLLFIEIFVLGAASIAAIYHLVLYIQQRDKFLMYYSINLFTTAIYIGFLLYSDNYNHFKPTTNIWYYILEEVLQITMVALYVLFASQTLDVFSKKNIVRTLMYIFFCLCAVIILHHIYDAVVNGPRVISRMEFAVTRLSMAAVSALALLFVSFIRTSTFHRTIIAGAVLFDITALLSILSFTYNTTFFGLSGVEPYFIGTLLDIIIFSGALGYHLKTIANKKNELLKKETESRLAVEKTRMRIAINLHDDVGSVLSSMSVYGEAAKRSLAENNASRTAELLDKIGVNARETMSNMSDIVWTINPVNDNGEKLFNKMEAYASSVLEAINVKFTFTVDEKLYAENFLMPVRQNIFFIFKEAITNCVKHAQAKNVTTKIWREDNYFHMQIVDDGVGYDAAKEYEGNGLRNIQQRAAEINGSIKISCIQQETTILFSFPINNYFSV